MSRDLRNRCFVVLALVVLAGGYLASAQKKPTASASPSAAATPAASPTGGGTAASTASVEVQMLSYGGLDEIFGKLASFVCKTNPTRVVVLDLPSLQSLQAFDSFYVNAQAIREAFSDMAGAGGAGGSGIDDFADITSAVATTAIASNSETSSSFTISDPTPALVLLNHLGSQSDSGCQSAYYGGVYATDQVGTLIFGLDKLARVEDELTLVSEARASALSALISSQGTALSGVKQQQNAAKATQLGGSPPGDGAPAPVGPPNSGAISAPQAPPPPTGPPNSGGGNPPTNGPQSGGQNQGQGPGQGNGTPSAQVTAFTDLDTTYNSFIAGLSTPNATTGQPLLSSIVQGFRIRALLAQGVKGKPITAIYVNVAFAGGTQRDRKNLFTNVFTGDFIKYSGGVGVNVIVFKIAGDDSALLFSDLLRYRTPLKTINKPGCYNGAGTQGDNLGDLGPSPTNAPKPKICSK